MTAIRTCLGALVLATAAASTTGLLSLASADTIANPTGGGIAPEIVADLVAKLIRESIPREYERSEDWGRQKNITTGLRSSGNFFDFDIHRRKTAVNHGIWKRYRVTLVDPDTNLQVQVENLRTVAPGKFSLTLFVTAKLHGWARIKAYDRGIHLIALEADGGSTVRLWLDTEITIESTTSDWYVPGVAVRLVVTSARLALDDFRLNRISDLRGSVARELGDALRHVIEDELSGPKLVAKMNASIEKRRDRLEFSPAMLLDSIAGKQ